MEWYVFETAWGWAAIKGRHSLISRTLLPHPYLLEIFQNTFASEGLRVNIVSRQDHSLPMVNRFRAYFTGEIIDDWEADLDLASFPVFTRRVFEHVYTVPYGEVMTYSQVAQSLGNPRAARAVGRAMSANPFPLVVPCHRVVGLNNLGGFSAPGGIKTKKDMLLWEKSNRAKG